MASSLALTGLILSLPHDRSIFIRKLFGISSRSLGLGRQDIQEEKCSKIRKEKKKKKKKTYIRHRDIYPRSNEYNKEDLHRKSISIPVLGDLPISDKGK